MNKLDTSSVRWCLHCERVKVPRVQIHHGVEVEYCGYADCDGGSLDLVNWLNDGERGLPNWGLGFDVEETKLELSLSRYPAKPIEGVVYPLYS